MAIACSRCGGWSHSGILCKACQEEIKTKGLKARVQQLESEVQQLKSKLERKAAVLKSAAKLLKSWNKNEDYYHKHSSGMDYSGGRGSGYGICREELRQVLNKATKPLE